MTQIKHKKGWKYALIVVSALFVLFSIASFVFIKINFDDIFSRRERRDYSAYLRYSDVENQYPRELLSFLSGKNQLQGYLYGGDNDNGLVVISHGLGGCAEAYLAETLWFVDHGYQVIAYDNTGCDRSEGSSSIGLSQSVLDLDGALTYVEGEKRFAGLPVFLYGHSWGGYAVSAIFHFDHDITASAAVAGFNTPLEMCVEWQEDSMGLLARIEQPYVWLYSQFLFGGKGNLTAVDAINSTDTPVLLIHGSNDETVSYTGAATIAYRDRITNPNVEYYTCRNEGQDGHNNLFVDKDALAYINEANAAYQELYDQYGGEIPEDVDREFIEALDPWRTSKLDEAFMQTVLEFYQKAAETFPHAVGKE